jgi:hypothetical protein
MDERTWKQGRRAFLRTAAAASAAALPASFLFSRRAVASPFGPLRRDPGRILDLPEGFSYRVLERAMDRMDDGYRVPGRPDGMGCFPGPDGTLVLMRNHENYPRQRDLAPWREGQAPPPEAYDRGGTGGVTRLVVRAGTFDRVSSNLVLAGTTANCAGGWSPWGWLSCEETVDDGHGYVFLCPTDADRVQPPRRIPGYGRFYHEAAVVDRDTLVAYMTEDRDDGCFYRFVPDRKEAPFAGRLQALRVAGKHRLETAARMRPGEVLEVDWVDVLEPDPGGDTVRAQAQALGAALFRRAEGMTGWQGAIYLCATKGGPVSGGQIFRHAPGEGGRGGTLELVAQSTDREALDMPDNIQFAPWGDLFMAENGSGDNFLVALDPRGGTSRFARNALSSSEFAGVCFSPDGRALFVNLQDDGLTLVVTGPFPGAIHNEHSVLLTGSIPPGTTSEPAPTLSGDGHDSAGCGGCKNPNRAGAAGGVIAGASALAWLTRRLCSRS